MKMSSPSCSAAFRSLNELRALLLEANRHSPGPERDLSREVHKAEWRLKEQKLKDDIKGLREKLVVLVRPSKPLLATSWGLEGSVWLIVGSLPFTLTLTLSLHVFFCATEHLLRTSLAVLVSCGLA